MGRGGLFRRSRGLFFFGGRRRLLLCHGAPPLLDDERVRGLDRRHALDDLAGVGECYDLAHGDEALLEVAPLRGLLDLDVVLVPVGLEPCDELGVVGRQLRPAQLFREGAAEQAVLLGGLCGLVRDRLEELAQAIGEVLRVLLGPALGCLDLLVDGCDLLLGEIAEALILGPLGLDPLDRPVSAPVVGDGEAARRLGLREIAGEGESFELGKCDRLRRLLGGCLIGRLGDGCRLFLGLGRDRGLCFVARVQSPFSEKKRCPLISISNCWLSCHAEVQRAGA